MARKRRNKTARRAATITILAVIVGVGWWYWPRSGGSTPPEAGAATPTPTAETATGEPVVPAAVVSDSPPTIVRSDPGVIPAAGSTDEPLEPLGKRPDAAGLAPPPTSVRGAPTDANAGQGTAAGDPQPKSRPGAASAGQGTPGAATPPPAGGDAGEKLSNDPRINASLHRYKAGHVIEARQELNRMLAIERRPAVQAELRRHLRKIADATIFSKRCTPGDPLVDRYTVEPGDVLLAIGRQYKVPYEALMLVNGITNAARIRAGQKIKVLNGPFHVKIHKSAFRLDVYLQDLYVRSFPVGLGAEGGTPEGKWIVENRLKNPTYYPSASAEDKRIIPPDDPKNPLGERWIGLKGIEGDAVGREGYGIHGTIDPQSIGKAVSLGCVRMHNADVAFLYKLLMPGHSTVTVLP